MSAAAGATRPGTIAQHAVEGLRRALTSGELAPGDSFDLCLCGSDLDDLVMTLCWVRGDTGVEYVWRFVM